MKCDLSENGILLVTPETSLEAFALNIWDKNRKLASVQVAPYYGEHNIVEFAELIKKESVAFREFLDVKGSKMT
jgi:hypothetical protein